MTISIRFYVQVKTWISINRPYDPMKNHLNILFKEKINVQKIQ